MKITAPAARAVCLILLGLGFGILVTGFFSSDILSALPADRVRDIARMSFYVVVAAWIVRFLQPMHYANALLLVWFALHIALVGIGPAFGATIIGLAAVGLGSLTLPERIAGRLPLALIAGLGILAGTLGWLLPFPIHYQAVYLVLAAVVVWWRRRPVGKLLFEQFTLWRSRVAVSPRLSAVAIMVLGLASTSTWLPTVQYDDAVYHVGLPVELSAHAYYRMDATSQIWALAPWSGDVVQAVVRVLAREDARSSVNLLWLAVSVLLIFELNRRLGGTVQTGWLAAGSFGSLPFVVTLLGGMQGELPAVAVSAGAALIVVTAGRKPDSRRLLLLTICIGLGLGLKITTLLLTAPLALWLLIRWRFRLLWREALPAAVLALLVAGSSYVYAGLLTGNPVLPLFNGWFRSQYAAPQNLSDERWLSPVRLNLLWQLTFVTDKYCECWPGAAGFHWLALGAALPVALAWRRTRGVVVCALAGATMVFTQVRYLRYILPMGVLLLPALAASLRSMVSARLVAFIFVLLTVTNVLYGTNASWMLRGGMAKSMVYPSEGKEKVLRSVMPEYLMADYLKASHGQEVRVLLPDPEHPYVAIFGGIGFTTGWYDPTTNAIFFGSAQEPQAQNWLEGFRQLGISHVLVPDEFQNASLAEALHAARAEIESHQGGQTLYRLENGFLPATIVTGSQSSVATLTFDRNTAGPVIVDARLRIRCVKAEGGALVSVNAYDASGKVLASKVTVSGCPNAGDVPFDMSLFTDTVPSRLDFDAHIGKLQDPASRVINPEVRLRRDAMKARDLSATIRRWVPLFNRAAVRN